MQTMNPIGAHCVWPFQPYSPSDLAPEEHAAVRERFARDAARDGLAEDAADEAGSVFYLHWLGRRWATRDIARGDHARAYYSVRAYARRSAWAGFTGNRRQYRGRRVPLGSDGKPVKMSVHRACVAEIALRERLRERCNPTPESVAVAVERISRTPVHSRKAYRLAKALGLPGVRELVRTACGFTD
jgi:hypothetical protein